ncbi:hypothetical protein B0H16DRAFT_1725730 [Mycena metata]|uniref:Uncharacterized protein n=1 Tax=Mycena metata TaxID=1033252 RepID=A0AAD7IQ61_9AGAR|nr:hypothetical protein B0H16DRAFT_1725730 [Mycena metata]
MSIISRGLFFALTLLTTPPSNWHLLDSIPMNHMIGRGWVLMGAIVYHNGKPYYCNNNGNWVEATMMPPPAPPQGQFKLTTTTWGGDQYIQPPPVIDCQFIPTGPVNEEDLDLTHPPPSPIYVDSSPLPMSRVDTAPPAKCGHPKGTCTPNFASMDTNKNLNLAEKYKPLGKTAWKKHARHFNKWAQEHNLARSFNFKLEKQ